MTFLKKIIWTLFLKKEGSFSIYTKIAKLNKKEYEKKQKQNLEYLWEHLKEIPYYKSIVNGHYSYEKMQTLPTLSREILAETWDSLVHENHNKRSSYLNYSGGSTGVPVKVMQDKEHAKWGRAVKSLYDHWSGLDLCNKQLRLWGSERDVFGQKLPLKLKTIRWLKNEVWINTFSLNDNDKQKIIDLINGYNPKQITAYVDAMTEIAKYILNNNIHIKYNGTILTSAGTLYPESRRLIEQAFSCKVFNRYGSREIGDIACSTADSEYLTVFTPVHFVEVLDENLKPVKEGEIGEIHVTTLKNLSMPLVRYKIGDIGKVYKYNDNGSVDIFESIEGRSTDLFYKKDGSFVSPAYLIHMFGVVEKRFSIKKLQFIQEKIDFIIIKAVTTITQDERNELYERAKIILFSIFGEIEFKIDFVDDIEKTKSGKYRYAISNVKA